MSGSILGGPPHYLDGKGLVSISELSKASGISAKFLLREMLNNNLPCVYQAYAKPGFWVEDLSKVDQEANGGFIIDHAMQVGNPYTFDRYLKPYSVSRVLAEIIENDFCEELVFWIGKAKQAAVFDFPGIRLTADTLLISKLQAKRLVYTPGAAPVSGAAPSPAPISAPAPSPASAPASAPTLAPSPASAASPASPASAPAPTPHTSHSESPASHLPCDCCTRAKEMEKISVLMEKFLTRKADDWGLGQQKKMRGHCELFIELMNNPYFGELSCDMMWEYKRKLMGMPENRQAASKRHDTNNAHELISLAAKHEDKTFSQINVNNHLKALSSMFTWAVKNLYLTNNPARDILSSRKHAIRAQDQRNQFDKKTLDAIFSTDWFKLGKGERNKQGRFHQFRPHHYWLPLIGLFSGARLNEICQLNLSDILMSESGVFYFDFNEDELEKVKASDPTPKKSLKNENSKRIVPMHPCLVELGLPQYVDALKKAGHERLFPELIHNSIKGYGKAAGAWFNERFLGQKLKIPRNGMLSFHSFRHTFITALDELNTPPPIQSQLVGHARGDTETARRYRKDRNVDKLKPYIDPLQFTLPPIARFSITDGLDAIEHALKRKQSSGDERAS